MVPKYKEILETNGNILITRGQGFFYNVWMIERLANGIPVHNIYMEKGEWKRQKITEEISKDMIPFMRISGITDGSIFSELIDALIEFGYTPKKSIIQPEEKSALQKHLEDMRKIVSKKIGVEL